MSQQILPETADLIVDFVNALPEKVRKSALKTCSQVSKDFNARSWYHLFHRVDITNGTHWSDFTDILKKPKVAFKNYVHELRLGRPGVRARSAAHTRDEDDIWLDARAVTRLLAALPKLKQEALIIGWDVHWLPIHLPLQPTDSLPLPASRVFIPISVRAGTGHDIRAQKPRWAPPCGPFALRNAAANNREGVGFRMVDIVALPLSSGRPRVVGAEVAVPTELVVAAEEVFLRIGDPMQDKAVEHYILETMKGVPAVDIRWVAPDSLTSSIENGVVAALNFSSAKSLTSLTLWTSLRPPCPSGKPRTADVEWAANLAVLQAVPPQQITRIRIGVVVADGCSYQYAVQQVKQLKWAGIGRVLRTFEGLEVVEGMVVAGDKEWDRQIWDVVWRALRDVGAGDGTRLVRGEPKIL